MKYAHNTINRRLNVHRRLKDLETAYSKHWMGAKEAFINCARANMRLRGEKAFRDALHYLRRAEQCVGDKPY